MRYAVRALAATPLLTGVAILSLALGIGANTAIFSIFNGLLLKPLPVRDPYGLVLLGSTDATAASVNVNHAAWTEFRARRLFDGAFAWANERVGLTGTAEPAFADAVWASGEFFQTLGVPAIAGRTFGAPDDRRDGGADGPVAVVSWGFAQRRFGGAAGALGRTLTIERVPYTVIGVTPPGFFGLNVGLTFDAILPLETEPLLRRLPGPRLDNRFANWLQIVGRLAPNQSLDTVSEALRRAHLDVRHLTMPDYAYARDRDRYLKAVWMARSAAAGVSRFRQQYGPALLTLLGIVGLVLLVACANIATLMLARAAARRYEFSVRLALGASRARLAWQLLTESLLLAAAGAGLGLAFAWWAGRIIVNQLSTWAFTAVLDLSLDWRVLIVLTTTTVAAALLFGTAPAFRAAQAAPIDAMKRQSRAVVGEARIGLAGGLVIAQVALSLMLVVGAGLFVRSFAALAYRDLGFDRSRLLVATVNTQRSAVAPRDRFVLFERLRQAAGAVAGVESAATSMATPLGSSGIRFTAQLTFPDNSGSDPEGTSILTTPVSLDWFRTYGTHLLAGRDFAASDTAGAPLVVIVNEAFARRHFEGEPPLGRTIVEQVDPSTRRPLQIVGLVENAAFASVRDAIEPTIYRPIAQGVNEEALGLAATISVSVRAAQGPPAALRGPLAAAIADVDRDLTISFQTVNETLAAYYVRERLLALLSGYFGAFALLLSALGLYGLLSHAVGRRRTEIGIRMALGARPGAVVALVLRRVAALVAAGLVAGVAGSLWAGTFISALLYGLEPRDPATLAGAAATLVLVGGIAGWLPAYRAARIDPAEALRDA